MAKRTRKPVRVPPCAATMGCLCAGHASSVDADAPCDTTERKPRQPTLLDALTRIRNELSSRLPLDAEIPPGDAMAVSRMLDDIATHAIGLRALIDGETDKQAARRLRNLRKVLGYA